MNYQRKRKNGRKPENRYKKLIVKEFTSLRKAIRILINSDKTNSYVYPYNERLVVNDTKQFT